MPTLGANKMSLEIQNMGASGPTKGQLTNQKHKNMLVTYLKKVFNTRNRTNEYYQQNSQKNSHK